MSDDLMLDSNIRLWVFLPIVVLTFLVEIIRNSLVILLTPETKSCPENVRNLHVLIRCRALRENAGYIPREAFARRTYAFTAPDGYLLRQTTVKPPRILSDPRAVFENILMGNIMNVFPMLLIGGWISWTFCEFITTKVPFPLTTGFKEMLQRGTDVNDLSPTWVSSDSWYLLNVFGQKNLISMVMDDEENAPEEPQENVDFQTIMKEEWELLQIIKHKSEIKGL